MDRQKLENYKRSDGANDIRERILKTGWQSWSPRAGKFLRWPGWNYCPIKDDYIPKLDSQRTKKKPVVGWCSWYAFGFNINEERIISQAEWFSKHKNIPVEYILIDGGWSKWGDWLLPDKKKFPSGLKSLAEKIQKLGLKAGIWIAPFLVSPDSNLVKYNPDWLVKKKDKFVLGFRGSPFDNLFIKRYILDIRKAETKTYLEEVLNKLINDYHFSLIKLDYLYPIYSIPNISATEAGNFLRNWLLDIKRTYPDTYTIASGSPLLPAINAVDSMRVGPDIIDPLTEKIPIWKNFLNSYKYKLVIGNIKKRQWMKRFWNLDPDVFVCRKSLGIPEKKLKLLQKTIKEVKGNIILGDDFTNLEEERIKKYILPLFEYD